MKRSIIFGEIEGVVEGGFFEGRKEMMPNSFHRSWGSGIDGNRNDGVAAIVLSGGYEDDLDLGDEIVYTGAGGNKSGRQVEDQTWENTGNAGLLKSMDAGLPVRVIRGSKHKSSFSPKSGYVYAGLYSVVDAWEDIGKNGYKICRFRLVYSGGNFDRNLPEYVEYELDYKIREKKRVKGTVIRVVRDSKLTRDVKALYKNKCQVCGVVIPTKRGEYSEAAHIKPLGKPHNGDDSLSNLICLCPNHHVMYDRGAFTITDDFKIIGKVIGDLTVHSKHNIDKSNLKYHRKCHGYN